MKCGFFVFVAKFYDICIDDYIVLHTIKRSIMSTTVTVSPKFQIVIPQEVRERMKIKPGQKITFMEWKGAVVIVPVLTASEAFGFLEGQDVRYEREKDAKAAR